ncbi:MAG: catalase HPII, partial [bacterium]
MVKRIKSAPLIAGAGSILSTVSGPSTGEPPDSLGSKEAAPQHLLEKVVAGQALSAQMPHNPTKSGEYGDAARTPQPGANVKPATDSATASTATEINPSPKVGAGQPLTGSNPAAASLDRMRVDAGGQIMTTNQGVPVADNQNSLKIGLRGPTALEDFIL